TKRKPRSLPNPNLQLPSPKNSSRNISSLIGAYLILDVITLSKTVAPFAFIGLTIVGVLAQSALFRRRSAIAA
ncbi:MAG: hypothetical protein ACXWBM_06795, partial [Chthoniobacterales bacterium]